MAAGTLLKIRTWVVAIGLKRVDETMEKFHRRGGGYKLIRKWPPEYKYRRVLLWLKPHDLSGLASQRLRVFDALNRIYLAGGWCVFIDDAGYVAGHLHLAEALGTMLNQGRSSGLSVMLAVTQPRSIVARMPSETFKQCRHQLLFKYKNLNEIKALADICGIAWRELQEIMRALGDHDFLYIGKDEHFVVRAQKKGA